MLVYDRIVATSADYQKKWLLHTINKPEAGETKVLKGEADNGILEAAGKDLVVTNKKGVMNVQALLPEKSRWLLIGGEDYRFYVETDGDQADGFDGENPTKGLNEPGTTSTSATGGRNSSRPCRPSPMTSWWRCRWARRMRSRSTRRCWSAGASTTRPARLAGRSWCSSIGWTGRMCAT